MIERSIFMDGIAGQVELQPGGWRTGYVFIPEGHPLYGCCEETADESIFCHGGVTFAGMRADREGEKHFAIGFDCMHYGDTPLVWTVDTVEKEVRAMIAQVAWMEDEA